MDKAHGSIVALYHGPKSCALRMLEENTHKPVIIIRSGNRHLQIPTPKYERQDIIWHVVAEVGREEISRVVIVVVRGIGIDQASCMKSRLGNITEYPSLRQHLHYR